MPDRIAPLVLVHGTATTPVIWDAVAADLAARGYDVRTPERPRTGDLARELAWLAEQATGCWVIGQSGGATLGLAAACTGVPLAGAVLHEPAVGSLVPDLLAPVAAAFADGGTAALGATLYGPAWQAEPGAASDDAVTTRELAMFRGFEPGALPASAGRVLVTHGALSLPVRARAADAAAGLGAATRLLDGVAHHVALEAPAAFADVVAGWAEGRAEGRVGASV